MIANLRIEFKNSAQLGNIKFNILYKTSSKTFFFTKFLHINIYKLHFLKKFYHTIINYWLIVFHIIT